MNVLTKSVYEDNVEFLLSKVIMHTGIGKYLDTPFHHKIVYESYQEF
jgi:hypothetical protein